MELFKTVKDVKEVIALTPMKIVKYYKFGSWTIVEDVKDEDYVTHMNNVDGISHKNELEAWIIRRS